MTTRRYPKDPDTAVLGGDDTTLTLDCQLQHVINQHCKLINNNFRTGRLSSEFNFKVCHLNNSILRDLFIRICSKQFCGFKISASYGCILVDRVEGDLVYYSAAHNQRFIPTPRVIKDTADKEAFCRELEQVDLTGVLQRPSSRWILKCVTNITYYVTKLTEVPIGSGAKLPPHLLKNRSLISLTHSNKTGRLYTDNLCFFRALALHMGYSANGVEKKTKALFQTFAQEKGIELSSFAGVLLSDIDHLSVMFDCGIYVFDLQPNGLTKVVYRTIKDTNILYLNIHKGHFSFINNLDKFSHIFKCQKCSRIVKSVKALTRHSKTCKEAVKKMYQCGSYYLNQNIFEELKTRGVDVPVEKRSYNSISCYDIECFLKKDVTVEDTEKTKFTREHDLLSVSICSNVDGYTDPKCFTRKQYPKSRDLVRAMINRLMSISEIASAILREELAEYILAVEALEDEQLLARFNTYLDQLVVCSFNGSRYDLNVLKRDLIPVIQEIDPEMFVIKRASGYMIISTQNLRFLDVVFYIEAGCNLRTFLRAYDADVEKGFMFYEYVDSLEKLEERVFPPYNGFFSSLHQINVLDEGYSDYTTLLADGLSIEKALEKLQINQPPESGVVIYNRLERMFYENNWCIDDYVQYYNNGDVAPFITALENLTRYYKVRKINPFKDAISGE